MSDQAPDAGRSLWAQPEAPDLTGPPRQDPPQPPAPPEDRPDLPVWWAGFAAVVAGYAVALVLLSLAAAITGETDGPNFTITGTYLQDLALFVVALWFARLAGGGGTLATLGWRRLASPGAALGTAIGVVVAFFVISGIYGALVGIQDASGETVDALGLKTSDARLVASAVLLVIVAPLVEETVFRGLLFGALWRWKGWLFGAVVSGIVFGGIHAGGAPAEALPVLALLGFGLAFLYWRTGSLIPCVGVHSFNNSVTLAVTVDWPIGAQLALVVGAPALAMLVAWAVVRARSVPAAA